MSTPMRLMPTSTVGPGKPAVSQGLILTSSDIPLPGAFQWRDSGASLAAFRLAAFNVSAVLRAYKTPNLKIVAICGIILAKGAQMQGFSVPIARAHYAREHVAHSPHTIFLSLTSDGRVRRASCALARRRMCAATYAHEAKTASVQGKAQLRARQGCCQGSGCRGCRRPLGPSPRHVSDC